MNVRVREVVIDSPRELTGLRGERSTHVDFARIHGVKFAPTVLFLDGSDRALAAPLVGGDVGGFYGSYLEQRLLQASSAGVSSKRSGEAAPNNRR